MKKRFSIWRVVTVASLAIIFYFAGLTFYKIGEFYGTLDAFSGAISRQDQLAARDNLLKLQRYYGFNANLKRLKLDNFANKHFFSEAQNHQAAYDYLTGRHEKIIQDLKDSDDYWGRFLRANAIWRIAQGVYGSSLNLPDKDKMENQKKAKELALSTKDDYESMIKQDNGSKIEDKWDYDLTTDPEAMMRGLMPKPVKLRAILGEGGNKGDNPGEYDGNAPGKGRLDLDKRNGNKSGPSNKPSSKREG